MDQCAWLREGRLYLRPDRILKQPRLWLWLRRTALANRFPRRGMESRLSPPTDDLDESRCERQGADHQRSGVIPLSLHLHRRAWGPRIRGVRDSHPPEISPQWWIPDDR